MRFISSALTLGALAAIVVTTPAAAQPIRIPESPAALNPEIIVQGERRLEPQEIDKGIDQLTRRTGLFEPVSRFVSPVCVLVIGLGDAKDAKIAARIRSNVQAVGLQLAAKPDCRPNAITVITDDPRKTFSLIRRKRPFLIGHPVLREFSIASVEGQLKAGRPAVSWSTYAAGQIENLAPLATPGAAPGFWGWNSAPAFARGGNPRFSTVLLLDWKQLDGVHVDQLADFATIHLLGSPRTSGRASDSKVPTILSLFEDGPGRAPQRLTTFDRAYLCGLYHLRQAMPNSRMNQNMRDVYDTQCVRVGAPALAPAGQLQQPDQPEPGLDTSPAG